MTSSPAPSVMVLLTPLVITRWYVGATAAVTMLTLFSTLLSLLLWVSDSVSRPADVLLPNWINGRPAALGIHVISSLQSLTLSEAARTQGHALQVGVQRKLASQLSLCGFDLHPSSGRNPWRLSWGLRLNHQGYRPIDLSPFRHRPWHSYD